MRGTEFLRLESNGLVEGLNGPRIGLVGLFECDIVRLGEGILNVDLCVYPLV